MLFQHTAEENTAWWLQSLGELKEILDEDMTPDFDKRQSVGKKGGRPYKHSPKELADKGLAYFGDVIMAGRPPTISGLCRQLNTSRRQLLNLECGRPDGRRKTHNEYVQAVEVLKGFVEEYYYSHLFKVKNPYFYIFALKRMGWNRG
jgi:hypothetical protein